MKSTTNRFPALNRRAEYLKLRTEKEKEKKQEENEEEELEEEEDDEQEDKNKQYIQKLKNIPITKTPINTKSSLNRLEKQKSSTSTTSQIPYNFTKSRMNYTSSNNIDLNNKNAKDALLMRHGLQDKKMQITGTTTTKNIQNPTYSIKQSSPYSPKGIKTSSVIQNNPPQILKSTNSQSNFNSQKISILGSKYSSMKRFGDNFNKEEENKNEIKIINKNNNYTINVTNNNNNITVNNNNISNTININEKKDDIKYEYPAEEKNKEEIKTETNKELNKKLISKKEPRKDTKEQNFISNKYDKKKENITNTEKESINIKKEEEIINNENDDEEEEIEEEMNLTKKEKKEEKDDDIKDKKRPGYVSNEQMIKNGIEIIEFTEEETNKIMEKKAKNEEKKKLKKQKKEKYINKNNEYNNGNNRDNYIFHKRGANNFVKRGYQQRHNYYKTEYDNNFDNNRREYNNFYERGRPNPVFRGAYGRRGRFRY